LMFNHPGQNTISDFERWQILCLIKFSPENIVLNALTKL
jgi:hypothetical protein